MRTPNGVHAAVGVGLAAAMLGACGPGFNESNFRQPRLHLDRVIVRGVGLTFTLSGRAPLTRSGGTLPALPGVSP